MIKKSRLEELIKQRATIYCADRDVQFPIPIFLNEEDFVKKEDLSHEKSCVRDNIPLEDLYETEKQAEWALKYQHIPRTEYLDLPMFEKFEKNKRFVFTSVDHTWYEISIFKKKILLNFTNDEYWTDYEDWEPLEATEENYTKACDLCVKLFKGE